MLEDAYEMEESDDLHEQLLANSETDVMFLTCS